MVSIIPTKRSHSSCTLHIFPQQSKHRLHFFASRSYYCFAYFTASHAFYFIKRPFAPFSAVSYFEFFLFLFASQLTKTSRRLSAYPESKGQQRSFLGSDVCTPPQAQRSPRNTDRRRRPHDTHGGAKSSGRQAPGVPPAQAAGS